MDRIAMLFFAGLGAACIYAGYKLFCDLPAMNSEHARPNGIAVFLMNVVPGVLLAVLGVGLLAVQAHGAMTSHRGPAGHRQAVPEGASWHPGKAGFSTRSA
jgi:hypothetical protein